MESVDADRENKKIGGAVLISDFLIGVSTATLTLNGVDGSINTAYFHRLAISLCFPLALIGVWIYQKNNSVCEFIGSLLIKLSVSLFGFIFTLTFTKNN